MPVKIFFCYAREDEPLLNKLKSHLRPLQREGLIEVWYDRDISAGTEWETEIKQQLNSAQIVLLLVSPDFMDSDYCYGVEMKRALERRARGEAEVIPVILRHVYWHGEPLGKLQALPKDGKPVTDPDWHNLDRAFYDVARGIRAVVEKLNAQAAAPSPVVAKELPRKAAKLNSAVPAVQQAYKVTSVLLPLQVEKLRLIRTLTGHTSNIWSVTISPDGHTLASGGTDNTIKIWNLLTGKEEQTLTGHKGIVWSVTISPDGHTLVSGSSDKTIKVWDLFMGKELRTLYGHTGEVCSVAISPDRQMLVSGSDDKMIKIWRLNTGEEMYSFKGHTSSIKSVAISPDRQTLVSGSYDETIKIWDLKTGKKVRTLIQFLREGHSDVQREYLNTEKEERTLTGHTAKVNCVAISPDGQTLVSGSNDNTIKVWNLSTGKEVRTLTDHKSDVLCVAISPDGQMLVSGSADETIKVWGV